MAHTTSPHPLRCVVAALLSICYCYCQAAPAAFTRATDPLLEWTGRRIPANRGEAWSIDWEGTRQGERDNGF
jgi:hypothetical protein